MAQDMFSSAVKYNGIFDDGLLIGNEKKRCIQQREMAPKSPEPPFKSSLGIKYPTLRDHPFKSAANWLDGKRADDGAEGLWRIHNEIYDLTDFIDKHPGGKDWLELTKGTDITEAFEVHHLSTTPAHMLTKFHVRSAKTPSSSPFTFNEDGFYRTLKNNVRPLLKTMPQSKATTSKLIADSLMMSTFFFAVLTAWCGSYLSACAAAFSLCCCAISAHNFFHRRDNFRMYYFDLTALQSKEWRVSHALSHHLYTNTVKDLELAVFEPWFQWLPQEKPLWARYGSWIYSPSMYTIIFIASYVRRVVRISMCTQEASVTDVIPFFLPISMYLISGTSLLNVLFWWLTILVISSFHFGAVGINAAHHHPEIFHDGDTPRSVGDRDWGICQLDAVMDRNEITGSHFLVLTNFGDHALHHMFPTLDHGILDLLYPIFRKTCKEFGVEHRMKSQLDLIAGQFKQLARNSPNPNPPGYKTKTTK